MRVDDLKKAEENLVGAVLNLDSAIEDMSADDPIRQAIEGYSSRSFGEKRDFIKKEVCYENFKSYALCCAAHDLFPLNLSIANIQWL